MRTIQNYIRLLLLACMLSVMANVYAQDGQGIDGKPAHISGPSGYIKDVNEMERSPLNMLRPGVNPNADMMQLYDENENDDSWKLEWNNITPAQRSKTNVYQFDPEKNVTPPAAPPDNSGSNRLTTQDPAYTAFGNEEAGTLHPSDAEGAAGPAHIVVLANGNAKILNKLTGATISNVTLDAFFFKSGAFDPRIFYDPYGQRWVALALFGSLNGCPGTAVDAKFRILISNNSDPTAGWYYYEFDFDPNDAAWLDFGILGFNKDWICVSGTSHCGTAQNSIFVFPKTAAYAGSGFTFYSWAGLGNPDAAPAFTYDNTLDREYLVKVWNPNSGGNGYVNSWYISTGAQLFTSNLYATSSPWQGNTNPSCPTDVTSYPTCGKMPQQLNSTVKFSFVQVFGSSLYQNCVYRNGSLWFTHPVFLPATGTTNRTSTMWWQVDPVANSVQQVGLIDDGSGTVCTFYPSISANASNDAAVSYCIFSPNYYQSAAYNFRNSSDPSGLLPTGNFYASGGNTNNTDRTGDYGETVVDPNDDNSMWAINQISSGTADHFDTYVTLLPAYYGCYTDGVFGNNIWNGNTKNEASNSITSQEMLQPNSNVVYDAGSYIVMSPGFIATQGCQFHAYINGCGGTIALNGYSKDQTSAPTTISYQSSSNSLNVYPNPSNDKFNFHYQLVNDEKVKINIYNSEMKLITKIVNGSQLAGEHNEVLDVSGFSPGIYFAKFETGNDVKTTKLVVIKN